MQQKADSEKGKCNWKGERKKNTKYMKITWIHTMFVFNTERGAVGALSVSSVSTQLKSTLRDDATVCNEHILYYFFAFKSEIVNLKDVLFWSVQLRTVAKEETGTIQRFGLWISILVAPSSRATGSERALGAHAGLNLFCLSPVTMSITSYKKSELCVVVCVFLLCKNDLFQPKRMISFELPWKVKWFGRVYHGWVTRRNGRFRILNYGCC